MGLEITFSKAEAIQAGATINQITNGSTDRIAEEEKATNPDIGLLAWLKETSTIMWLPTRGTWVRCGSGDNLIICASKSGRVYSPLTNWLRKNNIDWTEY